MLNRFPELYDAGLIVFDEPMKAHTSFQIGGYADVFCFPNSFYQLAVIIDFAARNQIPYIVIGNGSNLLVGDGGIRGIVITTEHLRFVMRYGTYLYAESGYSLKDLCDFAMAQGLSGLEFACGIPGSTGGAVYMNAGAYEGEMSQVISQSICLSPELTNQAFPLAIQKLSNADHKFAYRQSYLQTANLIHLASVFELKPSSSEKIQEKMDIFSAQRSSKQPLDYPSAGSVFKRPPGFYTGKLIDDCGLRGYRIGGAMISDKHCGFIINTGNATAGDVIQLIDHVKNTVRSNFGVELNMEIRIIGER